MSVVKLNRACCVLAHAAFFFAWSVLSFLRWVIHFIDYKWYNCINLNLCQLTFFSVCYGTILWLVAFHLLWYTFPSSCFFLCNTYNNCSVAKLLCVHTNNRHANLKIVYINSIFSSQFFTGWTFNHFVMFLSWQVFCFLPYDVELRISQQQTLERSRKKKKPSSSRSRSSRHWVISGYKLFCVGGNGFEA